MTVEKHVDWGAAGEPPSDLVIVHTDAEASAAVAATWGVSRRIAGESPSDASASDRSRRPTVGLLGGDLARTLGGRGGDPDRLRRHGTLATVDVGIAVLDGVAHPFVAHVIARRSWWRGRVVAVMNAQFVGSWDVAPRGHPGDGRLDVLDGDLGLGDRWKARSRLPAGTHVPHPGIHQTRTAEWSTTFDRPTPIRLDGELVGRCRELAVHVEPDALDVVV